MNQSSNAKKYSSAQVIEVIDKFYEDLNTKKRDASSRLAQAARDLAQHIEAHNRLAQAFDESVKDESQSSGSGVDEILASVRELNKLREDFGSIEEEISKHRRMMATTFLVRLELETWFKTSGRVGY